MNTLINKYDLIKAIIFNDGLLLQAVNFFPELD